MTRDLQQEYTDLLEKYPVLVFMKGVPDAPQCGFSYRVVQLLDHLGVEFDAYNILEDSEMREAVKEFANWKTYPQLYIKGELIGGCEIIEELYHNGELEQLFQNA